MAAARILILSVVVLVTAAARPARAAEKTNACGCYRDGAGSCYCAKKAKCGCPGDCEPRGCEEKRAKEMEREIEAETKRARAAEKSPAAARRQAAEREDDSKNESKNDGKNAKAKAKTVHLTAAQKSSLRHLLDLYLDEHPDQATRSLEDIRASLPASH